MGSYTGWDIWDYQLFSVVKGRSGWHYICYIHFVQKPSEITGEFHYPILVQENLVMVEE